MHVLSPFENDRLEAHHQKTKRSEHTGRTCTHHYDLFGIMYVSVFRKLIIGKSLSRRINLATVTIPRLTTRIDAAFYHHLQRRVAKLTTKPLPNLLKAETLRKWRGKLVDLHLKIGYS